MSHAPTVERIKEPTRKKCGVCEKKINVGDITIEYISSAFGSHVSYRLMHFACLLDQADESVGFEAVMATLVRSGDKDDKDKK